MPCLFRKSSNVFSTTPPIPPPHPLSVLRTFFTCSDCLFTKVFHSLNLATPRFWPWARIPKFCAKYCQWRWENTLRFQWTTFSSAHIRWNARALRSWWRGYLHPLGMVASLVCLPQILTYEWMHVALHWSQVYLVHHALKPFHTIRVEMTQPIVPKFQRMWVPIGTPQKTRFGRIHHIDVQLV